MSYRTDCVFYKEKWEDKSTSHHSYKPNRECGAEVKDFKKGYCPEKCLRFMHEEDIKS